MNEDLISIIVPIYNVENQLDRCIESLINQTYKKIEIILVNDGSTDNSLKICNKYIEKDCRIKLIHKENEGLSAARNTGLNVAKGKYILYVDSDDYIEYDACEQLLKGDVDNVDFIVGACRKIYNEKISYLKHTNIKPKISYKSKDFIISSIKNLEWYAPSWLNLYKRDFLLKNNLYHKAGYLFEDMEILPKIFLSASKISYVDYPFYNYVIRENSITTSPNTSKKTEMILEIYNNWMYIINSLPDKELKKYLYGILIKLYMKSAKVMKIKGWKIDGITNFFAIKYALNIKEKIKVLYFNIAPNLYIK